MKYTIFPDLNGSFSSILLKKIYDLHFFLQFSDFSFIHQGGISSSASPSGSPFASPFGPPLVSPFGQSTPSSDFGN